MNKSLIFLVLVSILSTVKLGKDYYKILEINRSATLKEIKAQYRKLSFKYHPDKNEGDPKAAEKFADVANGTFTMISDTCHPTNILAYEVLSDTEKRKVYDIHGEEGLQQHIQAQSQG